MTELFLSLPTAKTVLVTFPITEVGASKVLVEGYLAAKKERRKKRVDGGEVEEANEGEEETVFVRLGSTGVWVSLPHPLHHGPSHRQQLNGH